jgi:dihydrofolate reductase
MNVWLIAAISADGKIAQAAGQSSLDWTSKEDLRFFVEKTKEAGTVIMGRTTFDTIGKPLKGRRVIVMSRESRVSGLDGVEYSTLEPRDLLDELERQSTQTVAIAGGSSIYSQFLRDGLVTDVFLTIEPHLFGHGVPLASGFDRVNLRLVDVTRLGDQAVLLHFKLLVA